MGFEAGSLGGDLGLPPFPSVTVSKGPKLPFHYLSSGDNKDNDAHSLSTYFYLLSLTPCSNGCARITSFHSSSDSTG